MSNMMNNIDKKYNTYDAIVIGSGITGGWAAKELCENGLKTLLLERGRDVKHIVDYPTASLNPWDFKYRLNNTTAEINANPLRSSISSEEDKHFYLADKEQPYIQETAFQWVRGDQVGGRSLVWGRQCYRWSDLNFEANLKDGHGVDWPIRYRDLAPWYDYVERFIGVSGRKENLSHLPDGIFLPPMDLNCIEQHLAESIKKNDENRLLTIARVANLTRGWKDRGPCQYRNLCSRGCPFGGYFSSNSATLPAATATGNLTLRPFSIVKHLIYDDATRKVTGVRVIDRNTLEEVEFYAKVIFLNASTIASTAILLNSVSERFPNGLGNDSGQLGHNLMDHHSAAGASGNYEGYKDQYYKGRRPAGFLIPRFRNLADGENLGFLRGYNIQGYGERENWKDKSVTLSGFGSSFKNDIIKPGPWTVWMAGWGECLPNFNNGISLDRELKDPYGMPLIKINFSFGENEKRMMNDIRNSSAEILQKANFINVQDFCYKKPGGATVHEMGTARMGKDPKTSVLNGNNQIHNVKNVFVTDGSCMTSSGCQNPSLTYMALTARACRFAVDELKKGNL
ncbi:Fructose dehydrogenase large subunit [compost metagenome]